MTGIDDASLERHFSHFGRSSLALEEGNPEALGHPCERELVVPERLRGATKNGEEPHRARDGHPQVEVLYPHRLRVLAPDDRSYAVDAPEVKVEVGKAPVRIEVEANVIGHHICGEGDGEQNVRGGECHEAIVAA